MADVLEQAEIDALLSDAGSLTDEIGQPSHGGSVVGGGDSSAAAGPAKAQVVSLSEQLERDLARILQIHVPIIVRLADRTMPLSEIVNFTTGSIIEFEKSSDDDLELLVSNKRIGQGQAVKVGENFGLRITDISSLQDKIAALGGQ
jgi:flagellar motor switch protein FliN/FliY